VSNNYFFTIRKGDTFSHAVTIKQNDSLLDMTNFTFSMDIRSCIDDSSTILELTQANNRIDTSLVDQGVIILRIDAADTLNLSPQKGVYDLEWVDTNGDTKTILQGVVEIIETVTR
jgi:hypothetical protein